MNDPIDAVITRFGVDDYEEALALWKRTPGMGISSADEYAQIRSFLDRNPGLSFVARIGETLAGTVLGGSDGRRGYLYHLAVDPAQRRRGLGSRLAAACLSALKASGIEKCHLFLISDNELGAAFWDSSGWTRRDDIVVFSKNL